MSNKGLQEMREGHRFFDEAQWMKFNYLIAQNVSLDAAILFSFLYNVESYLLKKSPTYFEEKEYWFICKRDYIVEKINMKYTRQKTAEIELVEAGFISTKLGQGKLKWFKINWKDVSRKLSEWYSNYIDERKEKDLKEIEFKRKFSEL